MAGKKTRAPYGENMIHLAVRFWTNDADVSDPKTAWEAGVIYLRENQFRGIKADMERFKGLDDLRPKLEALLKKNGIKLLATNNPKYALQ